MINRKYTLLLLITLLSASSCNKWLDLKPESGIIKENYWQTKEQLEAAVIGCYSSLLDNNMPFYLFAWGELRADMVSVTSSSTTSDMVSARDIVNGNITSSNFYTNWAAVYETINFCNNVIDFAPDVKDNTLTEPVRNSYIGEARGLRALMYLYLLKTFREVPLQLEAVSSDTKVKALPKSSAEDVFNQIIADLKFAELYVPLSYGNRNDDKGRITRYTTYAIEADAYLWMDKYSECAEACDKIISSNQFALVPLNNQASWFNAVFATGNSQESIFEFQFSANKNNPFYAYFSSGSKAIIGNAGILQTTFGEDLNDALNVDPRGAGASYRSSDFAISKQAGVYLDGSLDLKASAESSTHWFVYRYSDILLLKAEALAWSGDGEGALKLVKEVRDRGHAIEATAENPAADDPIAITRYILNERAREFAFEGKRWFDLLRVAKRNNYQQLSLLIETISKAAPGDKLQSIINKYKDTNSHYLPININELIADKNLVQNPFYQ